MRRRTKQTQAAHPAVGKLAVALKAYKEAVEQQAATADILRALSRSSGNPQPVFDAIVRHAHRLCDGVFSVLYGFDGSRLSILADSHSNPKASKVLRAMYPMPATREHLAGRAVLERVAIHTEDCLADPRFPGNRPGRNAFMKLAPYRAAVTVPLVREGAVIGAIAVARLEPKAFSKSEMRLLQTFAEQALIAMENVRLFNETREALEHQKASAEVLRIVASSVESTAPVFEAITRAGMRLIPSSRASLVLLRDGALHYVSASGVSDSQRAAVAKFFPRPLDRSTPSGTAILDKKIINIADMAAEGRPFRQARAIARASGYQSLLTVPMLRDGEAIGAISVSRVEQGRFSEKQIALVRGFADQAVIAIRNAGFFREIHDRNAELKQSLEFQGALGEILASISSSIADTQPVFDAIVRSVLRLLGTQFAAVQLVKDGQMHIAAYLAAGSAREKAAFEKVVADYPRPVGRETTTGRAILSRKVVQFAALAHDPAAPGLTRRQAAALYESIIASPMLRQGKVIGAIVTARGTPEPFDDRQVALIKSFADQAVIAIENARLFNETKESLDHQRASTEVLKVVSASVSDSQPVFDAIAAACGRLFPGYRVGINVLGGDGTVKLRAAVGIDHAKLAHIFDKVASKYPGGGLFLRGKAVQYPDSEAEGVPPAVREGGRLGGGRAALYAPMVNEGRGIGSIWIGRPQPGPFSEKEVALLQTFAEQAVIALRNARLFSETKEALERQTATAEILKVIASSPSDVQPVFHAIAQAAKRLVNAFSVAVLRVVDDQVHLVALTSTSPAGDEALRQSFPRPVSGLGARSIGVAIDTGRPHASVDLQNDPDVEESVRAAARARGFRGSLAVPMLRGGHVVGIINATRSEAGRFSDHQIELLKTFADQAVIAIENVRLFNETKEALERQTATAEVLQVISASPTDVQPVFQAIAEAAMRLLGAWSVAVCRYDGELMHFAAACGALPDTEAHLRSIFPSPANPDTVAGEAIVERGFVELADATVEGTPQMQQLARLRGYRAVAATAMLRDGRPIGSIAVSRQAAGRLSAPEVSLLRSFADQAVIAVENVRLFNETKEALERQTATADILRVISASPTDVQPVFESITASAVRLGAADLGSVFLIEDGRLHAKAHTSLTTEGQALFERDFAIDRGTVFGRAVADGVPVNLEYAASDLPEAAKQRARALGLHSALAVPMLRQGKAIGAIVIGRRAVGRFSEIYVALLKTFADQAVIAIENARLFNETKEALERQTATSEILGVISRSQTDVQPVFDTIAESALKLCRAKFSVVSRFDGKQLHLAAIGNVGDARAADAIRAIWPHEPGPTSAASRAIQARKVIEIEDILEDSDYGISSVAKKIDFRSVLAVPMMRDGVPMGVIGVQRDQPGRFPEDQVALLKTFADQAVIAIENVRLFNETKEALERQTASGEILGAISSSIADAKPVFDRIARSCERLFGSDLTGVTVVGSSGRIELAAYHGPNGEALTQVYPLPLSHESGTGSAILDAVVKHFPDVEAPGVPPGVVAGCRTVGMRAIVFAPLISDGRGIGAMWVGRRTAGAFSGRDIALLKTFADQAVIAIRNAQMFSETKESLERQTATGEILKAIAASPSDVQPVFDTIVETSKALLGGHSASVLTVAAGQLHLAAYTRTTPEADEVLRRFWPRPVGEAHAMGVATEGRPVIVEDTEKGPFIQARELARGRGYRSLLIVPMLRKGETIGLLNVSRRAAGAFSDKEVALLQTFAAQAVIAIENVRLFKETKESLEQQTASAEILDSLSRSIGDTRPVFEAIVSNVLRLFGTRYAGVFLLKGDELHLGAADADVYFRERHAAAFEAFRSSFPQRVNWDGFTGRALRSGKVCQLAPIIGNPEATPEAAALAESLSYNAMLHAPLMLDGKAIGTIGTVRPEGRPFDARQLELFEAFAAQAVLAIENARLFSETKESLEQQTAISDVLRVISSSPTDVKPVLHAVAARAARICEASDARVFVLDGDVLRMAGGHGELDTEPDEVIPLEGSFMGRAVGLRATQQVDLAVADPELFPLARKRFHELGHRVLLAAPLLREDRVVGTILMRRKEGQLFSDKHIALLKTFADQAAIAIENVRLFNETKEALEQQKASAEVLAVISSSISDASPVFNKILHSCQHLFAGKLVGINVVGEDGQVHSAAYEGVEREAFVAMFPFPLDRNSGTGLAVLERRVVHVPDIDAEGVPEWARRGHRLSGTRAGVFAPLVWECRGIGAIFIAREEAGPFTDKEIALLQTFANQAAIAIQNARLFREIQDKSRQLEEASKHKSQFLASMSHELRTPLNAILGFNEMILGQIYGEVPADMQEPLTDIQTSGKHLLRLINNVLDLAKIEAGRMELALADYSVQDTVASVHATLRPLAAEKGLEFAVSVQDDIELAYGDGGRLAQCLMNLAGNSLKFTKSGSVEIAVVLKADGLLRWSVSDTGIGIPPDKIGTLFTEFKQTDATIASEYGGTGLGLSITKKFIEMHGGRIWVESELGKGSSFIFEIPVRVQT